MDKDAERDLIFKIARDVGIPGSDAQVLEFGRKLLAAPAERQMGGAVVLAETAKLLSDTYASAYAHPYAAGSGSARSALWSTIEQLAALATASTAPPGRIVECLSELMRGLEIPPSELATSPQALYEIGRAIAGQAKRASTAPAEPSPDMSAESRLAAFDTLARNHGFKNMVDAMKTWTKLTPLSTQAAGATDEGPALSGDPKLLHSFDFTKPPIRVILKDLSIVEAWPDDAQQEAQGEPVAFRARNEWGRWSYFGPNDSTAFPRETWESLYTHPAAVAGEPQVPADAARLDWLLFNPNEVLEAGGGDWFILGTDSEPTYFETARAAIDAAMLAASPFPKGGV